MLLDKAQGDVQIGGHEAFVDIDGNAAAGFPQPAMLFKRPCVMVDDAIFGRNFRPQNGMDLACGGGAM